MSTGKRLDENIIEVSHKALNNFIKETLHHTPRRGEDVVIFTLDEEHDTRVVI